MSCYSPCNCGNYSCTTCYPLNVCYQPAGCPVQLDTACVFYHQGNDQLTELINLDISNGATLEVILEAIDAQLVNLNVITFSLPTLRVGYVINTMKQFAEAVDTEVADLRADITAAAGASSTPVTVVDSATIDLVGSGTLGHTIQANVKISANLNNQLSGVVDGLYAAPQTLSVNYATKELTVSGGNTVSLASLASAVGGWLGNFAADPVSIDGQYWYNTTSSQLKIKVNGTVRQIQIV